MTRDGVWEHWFGMWFSSLVLLPIGVFLTYKAMNDSVILNVDTYFNFFRKLFFIRERRKYTVKSVIIDVPQYDNISADIDSLTDKIDQFIEKNSKLSYKRFWTDSSYDNDLYSIKKSLENILNQLSNSTTSYELSKAEEYPVIINSVIPFKANSLPAKISMYFFPIGIILRVISLPFELRIMRDLKAVKRLNGELKAIVQEKTNNIYGRGN